MGGKSRMRWRILERAVGQPSCVVKPVEQQSSAAQPVIVHASRVDRAVIYLTLKKLLALHQASQCLTRFAELGSNVGRRSDGVRKGEKDIALPILCSGPFEER